LKNFGHRLLSAFGFEECYELKNCYQSCFLFLPDTFYIPELFFSGTADGNAVKRDLETEYVDKGNDY